MIIKSYSINNTYTRIRDGKEVSYHRLKLVHDIKCENCPTVFTKSLEKRQRSDNAKHLCDLCYSFGTVTAIFGKITKINRSKSKVGEKRLGKSGYPEIYLGYDSGYTTFQGNWAREHVYVMEKHLGYKIPNGYVIHHIDGNKQNNIESNLVVMTVGEHNNAHAKSESLIFQLVRDGIIIFNRATNLYEIGF